ncbi:MAG: FTR1 family protein [Deltaproteobacteria bacterium]|nr:FTR1 family protein [Deltaproteobacteria bacterium]
MLKRFRPALLCGLFALAATAFVYARLSGASGPLDMGEPDRARQLGMLRVAVQEYGEGVRGGEVVDPDELATAMALLSLLADSSPSPELDAVIALAEGRAPVEELTRAYDQWVGVHAEGVGFEAPSDRPSLQRGRTLYLRYCTSCHGDQGDGNGPLADQVVGPRPVDFTAAPELLDETPEEFFQVMGMGLPGTAMPAWDHVLTVQERWDIVWFLWTLKSPPAVVEAAAVDSRTAGGDLSNCGDCHGDGKALDLSDPMATAGLSDRRLLAALESSSAHGDDDDSVADSLLVAARMASADSGGAADEQREVDPRHLLSALELVVEEYNDGVRDGEVVNKLEYGEARIFLATVAADIDALGDALTEAESDAVAALLQELTEAVYSQRAAGQVAAAAGRLDESLRAGLGVEAAETKSNDLGEVLQLVERARAMAEDDSVGAAAVMLQAYMVFEQAEKLIATRDSALAGTLEKRFVRARADLLAGREVDFDSIDRDLEAAVVLLGATASSTSAFFASLVIILREGLEAILVIAALATYLSRGGHMIARRWLFEGAAVGVVLSIATAAAAQWLLGGVGLAGELIEGVTMLLAALVLFSVSYWLLSRAEAERWQRYIQGQVDRALGAGSRWTMAGIAFLAVYREGFETVLFYRALLADGGQVMAVSGGFGVGSLLLFLLYLGIFKLGVRVPLRPFFSATGSLLYLLAFRFAGAGITELQEGGVMALTPVGWWPEFSLLGMSPDLETAMAQGLMLAAAVLAAAVLLRAHRGSVDQSG